tara:strand:- start:811 stop:1383 length:573 start_codon:yes stop_codon:yes gene_type:complete
MERRTTENDALLDALKAGKEEAYRQVFFEHFEALTYFANKYLEDWDAARDIVQEVFSQLFEKRQNLDIITSLKSYLYRSVANRSLNTIKSNKTHALHHDMIKDSSDQHVEEKGIELNELEVQIHSIIDTLPAQCAHIFRLSRFEHKTNAEIAQELGISKRTVETQISNALKVLRKSLRIIILQFFLQFFS